MNSKFLIYSFIFSLLSCAATCAMEKQKIEESAKVALILNDLSAAPKIIELIEALKQAGISVEIKEAGTPADPDSVNIRVFFPCALLDKDFVEDRAPIKLYVTDQRLSAYDEQLIEQHGNVIICKLIVNHGISGDFNILTMPVDLDSCLVRLMQNIATMAPKTEGQVKDDSQTQQVIQGGNIGRAAHLARHARRLRQNEELSPLAAVIGGDPVAIKKLLEKQDGELDANTRADLEFIRDMYQADVTSADIMEISGQNVRRIARREEQMRRGQFMRDDVRTVFPDQEEDDILEAQEKSAQKKADEN